MFNNIKGKPFFLPWADTEIAYDSILGISLTLKDTQITNVYIEKYKKTESHLDIVFTYTHGGNTTHEILSHVSTSIGKGITTVKLDASDVLVSGNITIIDSATAESTDKAVQLSPLYIKYYECDSTQDTIKINDIDIKVSDVNILFDSMTADVDFETDERGEVHAYITFNTASDTIIDNRQFPGITTFASRPIIYNSSSKEYEGLLYLPVGFSVSKLNDTFALITPYTYETCETGSYIYQDLGNIQCDVSGNNTLTLPLDTCFDTTEDGYKLNPYRIDNLVAPDKTNYWELNNLH